MTVFYPTCLGCYFGAAATGPFSQPMEVFGVEGNCDYWTGHIVIEGRINGIGADVSLSGNTWTVTLYGDSGNLAFTGTGTYSGGYHGSDTITYTWTGPDACCDPHVGSFTGLLNY